MNAEHDATKATPSTQAMAASVPDSADERWVPLGMASLPQTLKVHIVTANGELANGHAYYVSLPGEAGRIGILPGHDPVLALLKRGDVRITWQRGAEPQVVPVLGGMLEADAGYVVVLADLLDRSIEAEAQRQQEVRERTGQLDISSPRPHDFAGLKAELDAELLRFFESILRGF